MPKKIKKKKKVKTKLEKSKDLKKVVAPKKVNVADQKIEIKKIKKQPTEKKQYNINDYVVYPKHGVGKILAVEKSTIGQIEIQFYKIFIEKEKLTLSVPINQQNNLRPISTINQINKCVSILKSKPQIKHSNYASPSIRKLARELNCDLNNIKGTGRKNRITKEDIYNYTKSTVKDG